MQYSCVTHIGMNMGTDALKVPSIIWQLRVLPWASLAPFDALSIDVENLKEMLKIHTRIFI